MRAGVEIAAVSGPAIAIQKLSVAVSKSLHDLSAWPRTFGIDVMDIL